MLAGGAIAALLLLLGGEVDRTTPRKAAEAFEEAFNDHDEEAIRDLRCAEDLEAIANTGKDPLLVVFARVTGDGGIGLSHIKRDGNRATAHFSIHDPRHGGLQKGIPFADKGHLTWEICFSKPLAPGQGKIDTGD